MSFTPDPKPTVGRVVHFVDENKKGPFLGHVIEIKTEDDPEKSNSFSFVNLDVHLTYKDGITRFYNIPYDSDGNAGTWRYPPRL